MNPDTKHTNYHVNNEEIGDIPQNASNITRKFLQCTDVLPDAFCITVKQLRSIMMFTLIMIKIMSSRMSPNETLAYPNENLVYNGGFSKFLLLLFVKDTIDVARIFQAASY